MILGMMYLLVGGIIGFLVKHEMDIKNKKDRIQRKLEIVSTSSSMIPYNDTLCMVRELNENLLLMQEGQKKKEAVR